MNKVAVLGAGAFGSALANLFARNGHSVLVWAHEQDVCQAINQTKTNTKFLKQIPVHEKVRATNELGEAFEHAKIIVQAVPITFLRQVFDQAKEFSTAAHGIVSATKGLEPKSFMLPCQVIENVLGPEARVAAVGGPDFSKDLAEGRLCAASVACPNEKFLNEVSEVFSGQSFKVFPTDDLAGVQALGALKNSYSFALSVFRGSGVCPSQEGYLLFKSLNEMLSILKGMGGQAKSIFAPAGVADFVLTLHGIESRNVRLGEAIGQGQKIDVALKDFAAPPEGFATIKPMVKLCEKLGIDCPVLSLVCDLICEKIDLEGFKKGASGL